MGSLADAMASRHAFTLAAQMTAESTFRICQNFMGFGTPSLLLTNPETPVTPDARPVATNLAQSPLQAVDAAMIAASSLPTEEEASVAIAIVHPADPPPQPNPPGPDQWPPKACHSKPRPPLPPPHTTTLTLRLGTGMTRLTDQ